MSFLPDVLAKHLKEAMGSREKPPRGEPGKCGDFVAANQFSQLQ